MGSEFLGTEPETGIPISEPKFQKEKQITMTNKYKYRNSRNLWNLHNPWNPENRVVSDLKVEFKFQCQTLRDGIGLGF
jgi:hypothetical protein